MAHSKVRMWVHVVFCIIPVKVDSKIRRKVNSQKEVFRVV
jgi:hypothetical protein